VVVNPQSERWEPNNKKRALLVALA